MTFSVYIQEKAKLADKFISETGLDTQFLQSAPLFSLDSEREIEAKLTDIKRRRDAIVRLSKFSFFAAALGVLIAVETLNTGMVFLPAVITFLVIGTPVSHYLERLATRLNHGQTLEESGRCIKMHELAREFSSVAQYVREVTNHRRLYFYDYIVALGLSKHEAETIENQADAIKEREACLALHSGAI